MPTILNLPKSNSHQNPLLLSNDKILKIIEKISFKFPNLSNVSPGEFNLIINNSQNFLYTPGQSKEAKEFIKNSGKILKKLSEKPHWSLDDLNELEAISGMNERSIHSPVFSERQQESLEEAIKYLRQGVLIDITNHGEMLEWALPNGYPAGIFDDLLTIIGEMADLFSSADDIAGTI